MKPVRILVDSTVDLPERCRAQVRAVPLTVHFGDEELIDGVTIDRRRFYERLIESDVLPTTSQATPAAFVKEFEAVRPGRRERRSHHHLCRAVRDLSERLHCRGRL